MKASINIKRYLAKRIMVLPFGLAMLFDLAVNRMLRGQLDCIEVVESLKNVE